MKIPKGLKVIEEMPELDHWPGRDQGEKFDMMRSEVVRWMISRPRVIGYLFQRVASMGLIVFDEKKRRWRPHPTAFKNGVTPKTKSNGKWVDKKREPGKVGRPVKFKVDRDFLDKIPEEGITPKDWFRACCGEGARMSGGTFYEWKRRMSKAWEMRDGLIYRSETPLIRAQEPEMSGPERSEPGTPC